MNNALSDWELNKKIVKETAEQTKKLKANNFNHLSELNGVWEQYDCEKCYSRFDCKYKGQGLTHVCSNWFKDSSEHDKKVWDSAIDEFAKELHRYIGLDTNLNHHNVDFLAEQVKEHNNG